MLVRNGAGFLNFGRIFHSVHFLGVGAKDNTFRLSDWDSREMNMVAWVSLALHHLAFLGHKKSPAGGSHKACACFILSIIIVS